MAESVGGFLTAIKFQSKCIETLIGGAQANISQEDAKIVKLYKNDVISTDPPYYDNIAYADLSDFFYTWQKPILGKIYPDIFSSISTLKMMNL